MPPGRLLGTTTADPYYRQNQLQQLGQVFGLVAQKMDQRREKKALRDQAELERFFAATAKMPELAETWGQDLKRRMGTSNPEVIPIVDAFAQRRQRQRESEEAVQAYDAQLQGMEQTYQQKSSAAANLPDTLPGTPYPNLDKVVAQGEVQQMQPAMFPLLAAQNLPPAQRRAAQVAMKASGQQMPEAFDPFADLPGEAKGLLAGQMGLLQGEPLQALRYGAGFEQTPATQAYQEFQVEDREDRQAAQVEDRTADARVAIEKEATRHANRITEITTAGRYKGRSGGGRAGSREDEDEGFYPEDVEDDGVEPKRAGSDKRKTLSTEIVDMSKAAVEAYDQDFKVGMEGLDSREKARVKGTFLKERGKRPQVVNPVHARAMEREIRRLVDEKVISTRDEVDQASLAMTSLYTAATSKGMTPTQALAVALGQAPLERKSQLQAPPAGALAWPPR
jgi:hypothetical protein